MASPPRKKFGFGKDSTFSTSISTSTSVYQQGEGHLGQSFFLLKQSRKVTCQMHFRRAIDRWMETVYVRPMVRAGPPRISQECSRSQRFFLLNPEAQFREVVDKLGMLVCPSRPKKFGRARVSGHLGKIARITPGFL